MGPPGSAGTTGPTGNQGAKGMAGEQVALTCMHTDS